MSHNSGKPINQQIETLLLWQQSRGLRFPQVSAISPQAPQITPAPNKPEQLIETAPKTPKIDILFVSTKSSWNISSAEEAKSLLEKMIVAMKLTDAKIQTLSFDTEISTEIDKINSAIANSKYTVLLGADTLKPLKARKKTSGATIDFDHSFSEVRGEWLEQSTANGSLKMVATWHPAKLIEQPILKQDTWNDLKIIMRSIHNK